MRTTIVLDDKLMARASELTGVEEKAALVKLALTTLIQLEASRRLARMGGTMPDLVVPPRRRPEE